MGSKLNLMKTLNQDLVKKGCSKIISRPFLKWIAGPRFCFACLFVLCAFSVAAQKKPAYNRPQQIRRDSGLIEEKLVQLALQGPQVKISEHQNKINEYQLKSAKNAWLNLLTISTNYNDQSIKSSTPYGYVYPKYFFGVTVPLGTIISRSEVNAAREGVEISKDNQELLRRQIRADVLSKYRQYQAYEELIIIQNELVNDAQAQFDKTESAFSKGNDPAVTVEVYNAALKTKNEETAKLVNLRLQQDLVKIDLEKMIGTTLESVK
jgi:outer membrane protein TolC